jgi:hypothetical protein
MSTSNKGKENIFTCGAEFERNEEVGHHGTTMKWKLWIFLKVESEKNIL